MELNEIETETAYTRMQDNPIPTLAERVLKLEETLPKLISELKQKSEVIRQLKELINHIEGRGNK